MGVVAPIVMFNMVTRWRHNDTCPIVMVNMVTRWIGEVNFFWGLFPYLDFWKDSRMYR
jgi:hypothetical protein